MSNNQLLGSHLKFKGGSEKNSKKKIGGEKKYPAFVVWFTWILIIAFAGTSIYFGFLTSKQAANNQNRTPNSQERQVDLKYIQDQADQNPQDPIRQVDYARELLKAGKPEQAEVYFKKALEIDPSYLFAAVSLAKFYQQQKKYPEALALLQKAVNDPKNQDSNQEAILEEGVTYYLMGNYPQALGLANQAVTKDPGLAKAYGLRGEVYLKQKKVKEAAGEFESMADICRNTEDLRGAQSADARMADYYLESKNYKAADQQVDKILSRDLYNPQAYLVRAQIYLKQGKKDQAQAQLDKGLEAARNSGDQMSFYRLLILQKSMEPQVKGEKPAVPQTGQPVPPTAPQAPGKAAPAPGATPVPAPATR